MTRYVISPDVAIRLARSTRAAMIYMHGSDARQHEIVDTLTSLPRWS